eukprot:TRINITY_DN13305_c0_g1_i12.p1 TRINITY_DN13305_c0_g1~~TRINITY_DN13305_c0_g1_i12.p1  ORF type:complete len:307 (-),score=85.55 TRINITY_DN13305_c0_g1_i12:85-1005(-)
MCIRDRVSTQSTWGKVEMRDFMQALEETKPQFGADTDRLDVLTRNGVINYGPRFQRIETLMRNVINQAKHGSASQLLSVLIEGEAGTGKSALAAKYAIESDFPYVKLITPDNFVGYSELGKINAMVKIFDDAYRSPLSVIILDDLERLFEYVDIGARFSNAILQTIMVLVKRLPKKPESRLLIIGTSGSTEILKNVGLYQAFNIVVNVPMLEQASEIAAVLGRFAKDQSSFEEAQRISTEVKNISLKKLLLVADMAVQGTGALTYDRFMGCLRDLGDSQEIFLKNSFDFNFFFKLCMIHLFVDIFL